MRTWTAASDADPEDAWALLARPDAWSSWAPHLRGAWGLGSPEVRKGAIGAARLLSVIPVPAKITAPGGSLVTIELRAPGPLEGALAATYGPVIQLMLNRLARVAAS